MIWNRKYIIVLRRHADIALPFPAYSHCLYQSFFDAWQELPFFCVTKKFTAFLQWTRDMQVWMAMSSSSIAFRPSVYWAAARSLIHSQITLNYLWYLWSHTCTTMNYEVNTYAAGLSCFTCTRAFPSCMKTDRKASTSAPTWSFGWLSIGITCRWHTN